MEEIIPMTPLNQPIKKDIIILLKIWCLSACKKFHFFHEILRRYTNVLFCVLCTCLTTKIDSINLYTTLIFIFMQIINFTFHTFPKIIQRYCKFDIFDKLWRLSECKNSTWSCTSFLAYWKNIATFYIGNFGHV